MFGKKKPKRLYYPTRSRWYLRPRRKPRVSAVPRGKAFTHFKKSVRSFISSALYAVLGGVAILIISAAFFLSTHFSIAGFKVERQNFNVDVTAITATLQPYIGRSILLFPKREAVSAIQEKFPEYSQVEVKKILPNTLSIVLQSHPTVANVRAYYLLPEPEPELSPDEEKRREIEESIKDVFTLDEEEEKEPEPVEQKALLNLVGQAIFDQDEDLSLPTIIVKGLTQPIEDRQIVIPSSHMDMILDAMGHFGSQFEMQIQSIQYYPAGREIHLRSENGLILWLALDRDIRKQLDKLKSIYTEAALDKEDLAYIDLRVDEKVIYCPRRTSCDK